MVLAELGGKISGALKKLNQANVVDEALVNEILTDIGNALMMADVNLKQVFKLRQNI